MICQKHPAYQGIHYPSGRPVPCMACVTSYTAGLTVAALFIDPDGPYPAMQGVDTWSEERDARLYKGPFPVVCHSPCQLWTNMAHVNYKRYKDRSPEHEERLRPGNDQGCFKSALSSVRKYGGVLEHPCQSHAWLFHGLRMPGLNRDTGKYKREPGRWVPGGEHPGGRAYFCEVWQSAYDHLAAKATWIVYVGVRPPFELNWERRPGTHQIGWFDRRLPALGKKEASRTPQAFAGQERSKPNTTSVR